MSTYQVTFTSKAERQFRKLTRTVQAQIGAVIHGLAINPTPPSAIKMSGETAWRIRSGDYRVVYEIYRGELRIEVIRLGHRREVYDR
jgi:mRNA interferase RelE/StbE